MLASYGWSEELQTQFEPYAARALVPARVTVQQRGVACHRIAVDEGADQLARANLLHQGERPLKSQHRNADVGATLEPG